MAGKLLEWRQQAKDDVFSAASWYAAEVNLELGERFLNALHKTLDDIALSPAMGSTRHAYLITEGDAQLRFFPVKGFRRYLVYYFDFPTHVDVVRVWHASQGLEPLFPDLNDGA